MNPATPVRNVVICGGGTAGWMAAAALARLVPAGVAITLVESEAIGTVGVGEATIPPIVVFNKLLGIDETDFIRATHGTFKLGIEFVDWLRPGHRYMHPFGKYGADMHEISFVHFWLRWLAMGGDPDNDRFNPEARAAREGRFAPRAGSGSGQGPAINYAYQFDAGAYAAFLRGYAEQRGVVRREGKIAAVHQHAESGFVEAVELDDGRRVAGELFLDCTGFRGLLIEQTLATGYEDWSEWLPCNAAVAMPSANVGDPAPYTRSTAREAGWQWTIPLQHRTGNGYVFCDAHLGADEAAALLAQRLEGEALGEPRLLRFTAGRRRRSWVKNVVAIGLASGFLEPLESTSIHLIQAAITKLLGFFPGNGCDPIVANMFNADMDQLVTGIRDFIIAHYKLVEREGELWRHCREMRVPDSLAATLELFRTRGEVLSTSQDLFKEMNWFAILYGQGLVPEGHHPLADAMPAAELERNLAQIERLIAQRVATLPAHRAYLDHLAALPPGGR